MASWAIRQREAFITQRLRDAGKINRGEIEREFEVTMQTASADLARYLKAYPGAMIYDTSVKAYVRQLAFDMARGRDVLRL